MGGQSAAQVGSSKAGRHSRGPHSGLESRRAASLRRDNGRNQRGSRDRTKARDAVDARDGRLAGNNGRDRATSDSGSPGAGGNGSRSDRTAGVGRSRSSVAVRDRTL